MRSKCTFERPSLLILNQAGNALLEQSKTFAFLPGQQIQDKNQKLHNIKCKTNPVC